MPRKSKKLSNNKKATRKPATGFHTNPERINRNGAPEKEWSHRGLIRKAAERLKGGRTMKELIAEVIVDEAIKANVPMVKEYGDRVDGKAPQAMELTGKDGGPISLSQLFDAAANS